jgi:hypothetical protein
MATLLALDPGKTTGASLWKYSSDEPLECTWHDQIEGGTKGFIHYMFDHAEPDIVVAEQFVLDGRTPNPDVTPLQIEGALMAYYEHVIFQRNNFKKHVSNELLKEHDLYWKGEQHAMDSARHALAYMKINRHMPTLQKYFANEETPGN